MEKKIIIISRILSTGVHDSISNHFIVRGIKITPGLADVALFTKNATLLQTEKKIRDFEKIFHLNAINSNEMKYLTIELFEEMREMKATYEAEMLEHEHEENARRRSENARNGFHRNEDFLVGDHGRNGSHH